MGNPSAAVTVLYHEGFMYAGAAGGRRLVEKARG